MFALTIDQQGSRSAADQVPELLGALARVPTAMPFERTLGDEVQGLISQPAAVLDAVLAALRYGRWSIGLGIGSVSLASASTVREARGPALVLAREAVDAAKRMSSIHLAVRAHARGRASELQAVLRLLGVAVRRRTPSQWRVIDVVRAAPDRAAAARELGVSAQAVSKSLIASADDVVEGVYPLLARLLIEADERSQQ